MKDFLGPEPGEKVIVINEDCEVLYSEFEAPAVSSETKLHLLDVVDSSQQDVLRIVGIAFDRPGLQIESDFAFRKEIRHFRVVHVAAGKDGARTHIFISPKR